MKKTIFSVQAKMRSEVFCWKVVRRRGKWTPPQPTTVTMWPESMRNSSKVLCITTTAILLRYAFYFHLHHQPTHCLLVLPRQSIYHQPPIHHRIFFCLLSIVWKSPFYQTQQPCWWINYVHTYQPTHCTIGWFHQILEGSPSGLLLKLSTFSACLWSLIQDRQ